MRVWTIRLGFLLVAFSTIVAVGGSSIAYAAFWDVTTFDPTVAKFATVPGMPSCATVAPVRGDPRSGPFVVIVKLAAGCRVPWHWHTANEEILVSSGSGVLSMKDHHKPLQFRPGAYASLPAHHVHQARCSTTCAFFSISDGAFDIHYVDDAGKEISEEEAFARSPKRRAKRR